MNVSTWETLVLSMLKVRLLRTMIRLPYQAFWPPVSARQGYHKLFKTTLPSPMTPFYRVKSDARETPVHKTTWEDVNSLLGGGYEVDDGILPSPKNKPSDRGDTDRTICKDGCNWNFTYHRRVAGFWQYTVKLDGMNKYLISVLNYLTVFFLFLPKNI